MKNKYSLIYFMPLFMFNLLSCSVPAQQGNTDNTSITSNSSITPNVTDGQTLVNLKNGDYNLILNLKVSSKGGSNLTGDGTPAFLTKADIPASSPSASASPANDSLSKISSVLSVNSDKFNFDIPADKLQNNEHKINLTGLKKDDVVSFDGQAYDASGNPLGSQSLKDKKVEQEVESVDINFTLNISVNVSQNVTVNQSQTVTGPTINIILPTPPGGGQQPRNNGQPPQPASSGQPQQPVSTPVSSNPPPQPVSTPVNSGPPPQPVSSATAASGNAAACLTPGPDFKVTFQGTQVQICPPPDQTQIANCLKPDPNFVVTLQNGSSFTVCKPPGK